MQINIFELCMKCIIRGKKKAAPNVLLLSMCFLYIIPGINHIFIHIRACSVDRIRKCESDLGKQEFFSHTNT